MSIGQRIGSGLGEDGARDDEIDEAFDEWRSTTRPREEARAVIVLESDDDLRASILDVLEESGYVVFSASTETGWRENLARARNDVDVEVCFHIVDATVTGAGVFDELRADGWAEPIIAVAADGTIALDLVGSSGARTHLDSLPPRQLLQLILGLMTQ